ncbi:hypothetical protein [Archaeoglobus sp.]|nr:hypothetical protein [Archaeoglobus sp.]
MQTVKFVKEITIKVPEWMNEDEVKNSRGIRDQEKACGKILFSD